MATGPAGAGRLRAARQNVRPTGRSADEPAPSRTRSGTDAQQSRVRRDLATGRCLELSLAVAGPSPFVHIRTTRDALRLAALLRGPHPRREEPLGQRAVARLGWLACWSCRACCDRHAAAAPPPDHRHPLARPPTTPEMTAPVCQFQDRLSSSTASSADASGQPSASSTPSEGALAHGHSHDLLGAAGHGHDHGGTWTPEVRRRPGTVFVCSRPLASARRLPRQRWHQGRRSAGTAVVVLRRRPRELTGSCPPISTATRTSTSSTPASLPSATCPTGPAATGTSAASRSASEGASPSRLLTRLCSAPPHFANREARGKSNQLRLGSR
jgi:hypothetical protein